MCWHASVTHVDVEVQDASSFPSPDADDVVISQDAGGLYAAAIFSGVADQAQATNKYVELRAALFAAGIHPANPDEWVLARYNDPSTWPWLRRNEVLVAVKDFHLW